MTEDGHEHVPVLEKRTKYGFGFGHLMNDLAATMWFSYTLVFFNQVIGLSPVNAGVLLLIGQIVDGVTTPIVGFAIDRYRPFGKLLNGKKAWHLMGSIGVLFSFAFVFLEPPNYHPQSSNWSSTGVIGYYSVFVVVFQIAWATTQIAHLSLTGDLSHSDGDRVLLNAIRNAFTVIASVIIHVTATFLLDFDEKLEKELLENEHNNTSPNDTNDSAFNQTANVTDEVNTNIVWSDRRTFMFLAIEVVALGLVATLIFYFSISDSLVIVKTEQQVNEKKWAPILEWFKKPSFYVMIVLYSMVRLAVNTTATYMPFYLQISLNLEKRFVPIMPLIQFISGFIISFTMEPLSRVMGKPATFTLGSVFLTAASVFILVLRSSNIPLLVVLAVLQGFGTSIMLIQVLAITAELISMDEATSGFVYGFVSFIEKLIAGGVIMGIQIAIQNIQEIDESLVSQFYQYLLGYGVGGLAVSSLVPLVTYYCLNQGRHVARNVARRVSSVFDPSELKRRISVVPRLNWCYAGKNP